MKKLESKTVKELIAMAREWGLSGYSRLKKAELMKLLTRKPSKAGRSTAKKTKSTSKPATSKSDQKSAKKEKSRRIDASAPSSTRSNLAKKARALASKARLTKGKVRQKRSKYSKPKMTELRKPQESTSPVKNHNSHQKPDRQKGIAVNTGLAFSYEDGRFGLMARDPHWLYCFWDLNPEQQRELWMSGRAVLQVLSSKAPRTIVETISIKTDSQSWYVHVEDADVEYFCKLCRVEPDDSLTTIATSNSSTTPPDFASRQRKQKEQNKYKSNESDSGFHEGAAGTKSRKSVVKKESRSGVPDEDYFVDPAQNMSPTSMPHQHGQASKTLPSSTPGYSPGQQGALFLAPAKMTDKNDYWLAIDADIVLYGSTQPGSKLVLAGVPLHLDDAGHFRARFAFPDGTHTFTLQATSPDESSQRKFSLNIARRTES